MLLHQGQLNHLDTLAPTREQAYEKVTKDSLILSENVDPETGWCEDSVRYAMEDLDDMIYAYRIIVEGAAAWSLCRR